jgi:hypothetical protein
MDHAEPGFQAGGALRVPMSLRWRIAVILLLAAVSIAAAAPLVPPGDQPGRERYRFEPSPLDRFMQPNPPAKPLLRWDCSTRGAWRGKPQSRRNRDC